MLRWQPINPSRNCDSDSGGARWLQPAVQLCVAAFAATATLAQQPSPPSPYQDPIMRVNVQLVRVIATVKDPSGALVGSLEKSDFTIRDNGVPQANREVRLLE